MNPDPLGPRKALLFTKINYTGEKLPITGPARFNLLHPLNSIQIGSDLKVRFFSEADEKNLITEIDGPINIPNLSLGQPIASIAILLLKGKRLDGLSSNSNQKWLILFVVLILIILFFFFYRSRK